MLNDIDPWPIKMYVMGPDISSTCFNVSWQEPTTKEQELLVSDTNIKVYPGGLGMFDMRLKYMPNPGDDIVIDLSVQDLSNIYPRQIVFNEYNWDVSQIVVVQGDNSTNTVTYEIDFSNGILDLSYGDNDWYDKITVNNKLGNILYSSQPETGTTGNISWKIYDVSITEPAVRQTYIVATSSDSENVIVNSPLIIEKMIPNTQLTISYESATSQASDCNITLSALGYNSPTDIELMVIINVNL